MATKTKDTSVVGKEKKAPCSNSPITTTKKTPNKAPSTTNKPTSSPSEKQVPNYLKPTISSGLDSHSSFKLPRNNDGPTKPTLNRRRSLDPSSSSRLPKQTHTPSLSRQHKALVSPRPRERTLPLRSSSVPIKTTNNASKPIPERLSRTPKEGRTQPLSAKKSTNNVFASTSKKVIGIDASPNSSNVSKSSGINESEVEEAVNEEQVGEVENVDNHEELPRQVVDSEHEHLDQKLEESDQPHVQDDDEKDIPTVLEEKEDKNTNQDECSINESHPNIDDSTTEEVELKEEEQEQEQEEGGVVHKSETNNEEEVVEEKEGVEVIREEVKELREGQGEDEQIESEVKEEKVESPKPKQLEEGGWMQEKKEVQSPVSNDVIEENAGKQLEARRNKVRALAGAFQNVIDHQKTK